MKLTTYKKIIEILIIIISILLIMLCAMYTIDQDFYNLPIIVLVAIIGIIWIISLICHFILWRCPYCHHRARFLPFSNDSIFCSYCGHKII